MIPLLIFYFLVFSFFLSFSSAILFVLLVFLSRVFFWSFSSFFLFLFLVLYLFLVLLFLFSSSSSSSFQDLAFTRVCPPSSSPSHDDASSDLFLPSPFFFFLQLSWTNLREWIIFPTRTPTVRNAKPVANARSERSGRERKKERKRERTRELRERQRDDRQEPPLWKFIHRGKRKRGDWAVSVPLVPRACYRPCARSVLFRLSLEWRAAGLKTSSTHEMSAIRLIDSNLWYRHDRSYALSLSIVFMDSLDHLAWPSLNESLSDKPSRLLLLTLPLLVSFSLACFVPSFLFSFSSLQVLSSPLVPREFQQQKRVRYLILKQKILHSLYYENSFVFIAKMMMMTMRRRRTKKRKRRKMQEVPKQELIMKEKGKEKAKETSEGEGEGEMKKMKMILVLLLPPLLLPLLRHHSFHLHHCHSRLLLLLRALPLLPSLHRLLFPLLRHHSFRSYHHHHLYLPQVLLLLALLFLLIRRHRFHQYRHPHLRSLLQPHLLPLLLPHYHLIPPPPQQKMSMTTLFILMFTISMMTIMMILFIFGYSALRQISRERLGSIRNNRFMTWATWWMMRRITRMMRMVMEMVIITRRKKKLAKEPLVRKAVKERVRKTQIRWWWQWWRWWRWWWWRRWWWWW